MPKRDEFLIKQLAERIKNKRRTRNRVLFPPSSSPRNVEARYKRELTNLIKEINQLVKAEILPIVKSEFVQDASFAERIKGAFNTIGLKLIGGQSNTDAIALKMVSGVEKSTENKISQGLGKVFDAPDLARIIQNEGLKPLLDNIVAENIGEIQSLAQTQIDKIQQAVLRNFTIGKSETSLTEEINKITKQGINRAKFIARNQTTRANSAVTQLRQESLGVKEYIWRTVGDERVRNNHASKNGKIFSWDDPPPDTGHPGHDFNCRCSAQAVIDFDNLDLSSF